MPRRIRIDLEPLGALGVCRWLQQASPQRHHLGVAGGDVVDVEIEVQLLRLAVRPVWRDVVRRELKTEARCTVDVNRVPVVLGFDRALQEAGPECALGGEVGGVEHDDLAQGLHRAIEPYFDVGIKGEDPRRPDRRYSTTPLLVTVIVLLTAAPLAPTIVTVKLWLGR
jgi:hypothetical protein